MADIVFLDTETLGLDPDAPIWEFAAMRRITSGPEIDAITVEGMRAEIRRDVHLFILHDPADWVDSLPKQFQDDYFGRYDETAAFCERFAAREIDLITRGGHIVGCNPGFDIERLAKLLRRNHIEPSWHYHPDDISSVAKGYLAAKGQLPEAPQKSDELSAALGIDPADYPRHTAMGDVLWTMAQWDTVMRNA